MNEFERALAKTEKREQRKTLHMPRPEVIAEVLKDVKPAETFAVPKEKPSVDAIIRVSVSMPGETFEIQLVKPNILSNVVRKPTRADFQKALIEGLRPLLGTVK